MILSATADLRTPADGALVIIGASTGGVRALCTLFQNLPALHAGILVVQHMPRFIQPSFVRTLRDHTSMSVDLARSGDVLGAGTVLLAPAESHCVLEGNRHIRLVTGPKVHFVCPAIDVTMKSVVAPATRNALIGIILTGMGRDGADGMVHLKQFGARTMAQDQASSAVFGMPMEAWKAGGTDLLLPPERIALTLTRWVPQARTA